MGEAHKLNIEEQKTLIKRYVNNLINSVPVIVGVSNAGLDNGVRSNFRITWRNL